MTPNVSDYQDYKRYLIDTLDSGKTRTRGRRARLAEAAKCHITLVSQVLNGSVHFSLEQSILISEHLGHSESERNYFLLLVQFARAGSTELKAHFERQVKLAQSKSLKLKNRLGFKTELNEAQQATYYSSWCFAAIHVVLSIPELQSPDALANYFGLPLKRVKEVLDYLCSMGLAKREGTKFTLGKSRIYLADDSPWISKHHSNWRIQAIQSLERKNPRDLHYSAAIGVAESDALKVRSILLQAIEQIRAVVKDSKEDAAFAYSMDLFALKEQK